MLRQLETGIQDTGSGGATQVDGAPMDFNGASAAKLLGGCVEIHWRDCGNGEEQDAASLDGCVPCSDRHGSAGSSGHDAGDTLCGRANRPDQTVA
jgi:hypothetical protein